MKEYSIPGSNNRPITFDLTVPKNVSSAPLILFLHGFKGFKDWAHWPVIGKKLVEHGYAVLKMNFSHNGTTPEKLQDFADLEAFGKNTFTKEQTDVDDVLDWLFNHPRETAGIDLNKINLVAHSRGGATAIIKAVNDNRIKKVVTWSSVSYLNRYNEDELALWKSQGVVHIHNARTGQDMPLYFSLAEDFMENEEEFTISKACSKLHKPLLVIHAENDETVPLEEAHHLTDWSPMARLVVIPEADHSFSGFHPYTSNELSEVAESLVEETINFLAE